ncbi:PadR family transcriptional regulator [Metabacillus halosaccharovorans]|uniref:PadR family transcriptional regulator n=1 Tax=Metabacillus halosaccharovorans TaxID=930124 RepID=UPI001C1FBBD7|nr:PadR family transcriptional regulator [Metabacillus halosaccharovorans]MBU7591684.1 PadR family transcriptional regulator [Metabacillus halosaccharovorans]
MLGNISQEMLTLLTFISRKPIKQGELFLSLGNEFTDSSSCLYEAIEKGFVQKDEQEVLSLTHKGLKTALKFFDKQPHLREKMKSKFTKRRGIIQLAILQLLKEEPRHGYQVMKQLEERSGGYYSPSAGTIYPALQDLVEKKLIEVKLDEDKKIYALNEEGLEFINDLISEEDDIFWQEWAMRLRWKQSEEASLVREEMGKLQLEFHYAMKRVLSEPDLAKDVLSILNSCRGELINWSDKKGKNKGEMR